MKTKLTSSGNPPSFRRSLPMQLFYALDAILPAYRELFARYDVTEQQWRILRVLWNGARNQEQINATELSRRTLLPTPSLVGILDRLEKKDLVKRLRSTSDRRSIYITTTPKGQRLAAEVLPLVEQIQADQRTCLSDDDWQALDNILGKITETHKEETS